MLRPDTLALTALLALLTSLGPVSTDMYLPSLPDIGRLLRAPPGEVQLTLSAYLVGFAIGQIFYGPLSDRYGRKPVLIISLGVYCLGSIVCALAPNIEMLIASRVLQAVGACGAVVVARAVVRDLYSGPRAGRELSLMGAIMALAPVVAPLIGSAMQTAFGWRANFLLAGGVGLLAAALTWRQLPETLRERVAGAISVRSIVDDFRIIARHRGFLAHLLIVSSTYSGLFAWISGSPFVLQDLYGLTPFEFGAAFTVCGVGFLIGTAFAARLVTRIGLSRTIGWGTLITAIGGSAMAAFAFTPFPVVILVLSMMIYLAGMGLAMPQAMAGALTPFPHHAGAASSLLGLVQQTCAAAVGIFVGQMLGQSAWPLAIPIAAAGCLALLIWAVSRGARDRTAHQPRVRS